MKKTEDTREEVVADQSGFMGRRSEICRRCGRKLKTPASVEVGFGTVCFKKFMSESALKPLFIVGGGDHNENS